MTSARHRASVLAGAALIVLFPALAGCGTEHAQDTGSAAASGPGTVPPSPAGPTPYGEEGPGDANPHYAENHAFQSTLDLSAADRAKGEAEAAKVRAGLAGLAQERGPGEKQLRKALTGLGYAPGAIISTGTLGPHGSTFVLGLGRICVDGSLSGSGDGLVTAEAHGRYMEGTGCVKPVGGH
ncbi:hypothetical protein ACFVW8_08990 [Streptomyces sp. NPDC058221]|uniref:hypothetical protein n=1 Tax=Streptomyces sp. NPDC058221 TaxID=3346388 RepID=UPI0036F160B7